MDDIKTPEELLIFMSNNINYGYLGKNGRVYNYDDFDFDSNWYEQYILESKNDILKNLYGNCWDQVELERDWFLGYGKLKSGIYRLVKRDLRKANSPESRLYSIYAGFDIKWCS